MKHFAVTVLVAFAQLFHASTMLAQDGTRHVSLRSTYLSTPVEDFRQFTLIGDLSDSTGSGTLESNPNACTIGAFGDTELCTKIASSVRTVQLVKTRTADPLGLNRSLWAIIASPLKHSLFLVVPEDESGVYRLIHQNRAGTRTVIALEPLVYHGTSDRPTPESTKASVARPTCSDLPQTVDNVEASAVLRPGFVNNTFFLGLFGNKSHTDSWVEIEPLTYKQQPEYWEIHVKECLAGDASLLHPSPYQFFEEVTHTIGTKGIELHWNGDEVQRIDKP